jgi:hypothetical protein
VVQSECVQLGAPCVCVCVCVCVYADAVHVHSVPGCRGSGNTRYLYGDHRSEWELEKKCSPGLKQR